ncbi:MAG TPA: hypothetical protein VGX48_15575 [Pyrinomonadaceae bacterium]|jgi:hypothetical protein|nr:hypothetical protein [Pyrinomonadaceae bacterium]
MERDQYFDDFFPSLSRELTSRIARANAVAVEEDAESLDEEDLEELDPERDEAFEERNDDPPPTLARREAERDEWLEACRLTTRERLYRYLSFLARSPRARSGEAYPIFEVLPDAMGSLLGIEGSHRLMWELTDEFRDWLAHQTEQRFNASWGWMRLLDDSYLRLMAEKAEREESRRRLRDSFPAYRPRTARNR